MVSSRLAQRRRCDSFVIFMDMPPLRFRAHGVVVHPASPTLVSCLVAADAANLLDITKHSTHAARGVREKAGEKTTGTPSAMHLNHVVRVSSDHGVSLLLFRTCV